MDSPTDVACPTEPGSPTRRSPRRALRPTGQVRISPERRGNLAGMMKSQLGRLPLLAGEPPPDAGGGLARRCGTDQGARHAIAAAASITLRARRRTSRDAFVPSATDAASRRSVASQAQEL